MVKHPVPPPLVVPASSAAVSFSSGGTTNDYAVPSEVTFLAASVSSAGDHTITGFAGGTPGRVLVIANQGGRILLTHADTGSAVGNRLSLLTGATTYLTPFGRAVFVYDDVTNVWYQVAGSLQGNVTLARTAASGAGSYGGGVGVVSLQDAVTVPSSNPTAGGVLYSEAGALKWRGSSGTVTPIAPA
jgi:hypothetical protein